MASQERVSEALPPYSRCPSAHEQVLAIAPDFPLAVSAIRLVQERFPGTSTGDAWEFVQQLAILVRTDVHNRQSERTRANDRTTAEHAREDVPSSVIPEDSPMPDVA